MFENYLMEMLNSNRTHYIPDKFSDQSHPIFGKYKSLAMSAENKQG